MHRGLALAVLLVGPLLAATAGAAPSDGPRLDLYAHWPGDVQTGMEQPIPLTTLSPLGEPDLSQGPATPGSSSAGTLPTFTYQLINPDGSPGPYGPVHLDTTRSAVLTFYLSADQAPWPAAAGDPPEDVDHGIAPRVTVEAQLSIGHTVVSETAQTQHLVTAPEPVGTAVTAYTLELPVDRERVEAGEGLEVEIRLHQLDRMGEQTMQPGFNVHTGEAYPTGLSLPFEPADPGPLPAPLETASTDTETIRQAATGTLVVAAAVAGAAGLKLAGALRSKD